jgi:hypothetical protein
MEDTRYTDDAIIEQNILSDFYVKCNQVFQLSPSSMMIQFMKMFFFSNPYYFDGS